MQWIRMVRTSDGVLHEDELKAARHADQRYGRELTRIATALCQTDGKYSKTVEYLDAHLGEFVTLAALKADVTLQGDDDNDD